MAVLEFIINNILTQAAVVIGLVACLGLVLQKKPANDVLLGTFKTMLGFLVLAAGSSVMQGSLAYFGDMFNSAFGFNGMTAVVASIEGINGQAMTDLGLGSEIAICLAGIFVVNIILARFTKFKYVFLTGQALLWESTLCVVFAFFCGLRGIPLIVVSSIVGGAFATLMPAFAQPLSARSPSPMTLPWVTSAPLVICSPLLSQASPRSSLAARSPSPPRISRFRSPCPSSRIPTLPSAWS